MLDVSRFRIFGPTASSRVQGEESVVCMTGIRFLHGITGWLRGIQCDQRLMELLGAPPTLAYYLYLGHSPRGQCQIFTVTGRLDQLHLSWGNRRRTADWPSTSIESIGCAKGLRTPMFWPGLGKKSEWGTWGLSTRQQLGKSLANWYESTAWGGFRQACGTMGPQVLGVAQLTGPVAFRCTFGCTRQWAAVLFAPD